MITDGDNEIFFSIVSLWEIQIKHILHPDQMKSAGTVAGFCRRSGYKELELTDKSIDELLMLSRPDDAPRHKDPFDKMLICQSIAEDMLFLTHDSLLGAYDTGNILTV